MSTFHVSGIKAVWRRQVGSLLGNPLGYLFILAFVLIAGGFLYLPDSFYSRNISDLGPLHGIMPWLLIVLLPALGMGAWATERELGTEELLLTMPLSIADAIVGKFLAVSTYYTIALACSLSNVAVLWYLGTPDFGLIAANYVGWWLAGLAFAAVSLIASVQVSMPAIAFVLGVIYCAIIAGGAHAMEWFDASNRGVMGLGNVVVAVGTTIAALVVAMLQLASRRWRPGSQVLVITQVCATAFGLLLAVNLGRISYRNALDSDLSSERLSSISPSSMEIVRKVDQTVTIAAFISKSLPEELQLKAKEVEDKLKAVERASGGQIALTIYRPVNAYDKAGATGQQQYGVKPFKAVVNTVGGREMDDVFLGAAITSGSRSQVINVFEPGLSVEYELIRAIRAVGHTKKPVLGLASTEIKLNGDFDYMSGNSKPAWAAVEELRKQYDVRDVNLDQPVVPEIAVLVAVQPSTLTPVQLEHLHDYIWEGRPCLVMEDPLPMWSGPQLAASQPRRPPQQQMGGGQENEGPKADLKPLYKSLGIDLDIDGVAWSAFNPSHQFKNLPQAFVWCMRNKGSIKENAATTGIDSLLLPWPGMLYESKEKSAGITVTPLVQPSDQPQWGRDTFNDYVTNMMGQYRPAQKAPDRFGSHVDRSGRIPALAVEITGIMPSSYPKPDPSTIKKDETKTEENKDVAKTDDKKDEAKKEEPKPENKKGVPSAKPVHVIVIADTDFATDQFFEIYRNQNNQLGSDELAVLRNLRNVQFLANAVDTLANEQELMSLRTRRPQARPLVKLEDLLVGAEKQMREKMADAEQSAVSAIEKARAEFQTKQDKVRERDDLDDNAKEQLRANIAAVEQRKLDSTIEEISRDKDVRIAQAKGLRNEAIDDNRFTVRLQAVGLPAIIMVSLVLVVLLSRLRQERRFIPSSRKRGTHS